VTTITDTLAGLERCGDGIPRVGGLRHSLISGRSPQIGRRPLTSPLINEAARLAGWRPPLCGDDGAVKQARGDPLERGVTRPAGQAAPHLQQEAAPT
jgi:hypothetical protein